MATYGTQTMKPTETPLTDFVEVGKLHYRIYKEVWPNGDVRFFYRKGRLATIRTGPRAGEQYITGKIYEGSDSDDKLITIEAVPRLKSYRTQHQAETKTQVQESSPETDVRLELITPEQARAELQNAS